MGLAPPPLDNPIATEDGKLSAPWARWIQQLWSSATRVELIERGPSVTQGVGAPTSALPSGSIYLRTDGAGPSFYVRQGAAWVAK